MVGISKNSRRTAARRALAALAVVALSASLAQAEFVVDHYCLGDAQGAESLQIAVVNDIQGDLWKLDTAVNRLIKIDSVTPLSVVMLAGDFCGHVDTTNFSRWNQITAPRYLVWVE